MIHEAVICSGVWAGLECRKEFKNHLEAKMSSNVTSTPHSPRPTSIMDLKTKQLPWEKDSVESESSGKISVRVKEKHWEKLLWAWGILLITMGDPESTGILELRTGGKWREKKGAIQSHVSKSLKIKDKLEALGYLWWLAKTEKGNINPVSIRVVKGCSLSLGCYFQFLTNGKLTWDASSFLKKSIIKTEVKVKQDLKNTS